MFDLKTVLAYNMKKELIFTRMCKKKPGIANYYGFEQIKFV